MLKKSITYEDYNGNVHTEDFYFNLTQAEIVKLEVASTKGQAYSDFLQGIKDAEDNVQIYQQFERIVGISYGERDPDGKRFHKSEAITDNFRNHAAYSVLMMELTTDDGAAAAFCIGIAPAQVGESMATRQAEINKELTKPVAEVALPEEQKMADVDPTPWITEGREPTKQERSRMTKEQLIEAIKARQAREAQVVPETAPPVLEDQFAHLKALDDYTTEELVELSPEELNYVQTKAFTGQ